MIWDNNLKDDRQKLGIDSSGEGAYKTYQNFQKKSPALDKEKQCTK